MRLLKRNTTEFEYLPYDSTGSDVNEDGDHTGDFDHSYDDPVKYIGNISSPSGNTNQTFYGQDIRYTHTLLMDKPDVPIDERGLIRWKSELYDIVAVRPSINFLSIALRKQTENNYTEPESEGD